MYHITQIVMMDGTNIEHSASSQGNSDTSSTLGIETNTSSMKASPLASSDHDSGNTSPFDLSGHSSSSGTGSSPPEPKKKIKFPAAKKDHDNGMIDLSSHSSSSTGTGSSPPKNVFGQFILTKTVQHIDTHSNSVSIKVQSNLNLRIDSALREYFSRKSTEVAFSLV